jgi:hypothetical protein
MLARSPHRRLAVPSEAEHFQNARERPCAAQAP